MNNSDNTVSVNLGTIMNKVYDYLTYLIFNPQVIMILVIGIVLYIVMFVFLGERSVQQTSFTSSPSSGSSILTNMVIMFLIIMMVVMGLQYLLGVDIIEILKKLLFGVNSDIKVDIVKNDVPDLFIKKQVFNIPENDFIYSDAKALCSAYGGRLATYNEVEDAYNSGGEWCNYGWSEGQMALFPTQQSTFDKLKKINGHENDCGRPGVNGGYIDNPQLKFGVNCYGYKPKMTATEEELMATRPIYPKTEKDLEMENRVKYWKDQLSRIIVSPFNHNSWSKL